MSSRLSFVCFLALRPPPTLSADVEVDSYKNELAKLKSDFAEIKKARDEALYQVSSISWSSALFGRTQGGAGTVEAKALVAHPEIREEDMGCSMPEWSCRLVKWLLRVVKRPLSEGGRTDLSSTTSLIFLPSRLPSSLSARTRSRQSKQEPTGSHKNNQGKSPSFSSSQI